MASPLAAASAYANIARLADPAAALGQPAAAAAGAAKAARRR